MLHLQMPTCFYNTVALPQHNSLVCDFADSSLGPWSFIDGDLEVRELIQLRTLPIWQHVGKTAIWSLMAMGAGSAVAQNGLVEVVVNHNAIPESATGPAGGSFAYAPLVSLNAGSAAKNLKLTQVLPVGVRLDSIAFEPSNGGACSSTGMPFDTTAANNTIACDLNDINVPGTENGIRVLFNVTIPEVGTDWAAYASATADNASETPGSNKDLERRITTTEAADLGIDLFGPAGGVKQFSPFDYRIQVSNYGPSAIPATGKVVVEFTVPAESSAGQASGAGWSCDPNGGDAGTKMVCSHAGPLERDTKVANDLIIPVTPLASGELTATANVTGKKAGETDMPDAVLTNNTKVATVMVEKDNVVDITVAKTASPTTIDQTDAAATVTYTITPTRVSGADAPNNVQIVDPLLDARISSYTLAPTNNWDCTASTASKIDCSFTGDTTPAVGSAYPPVTFTAIVNPTAGGTVENTATVSAENEAEGARSNNTSTAVVHISNQVNLTLNKSASKSPIKAGEAFDWTLNVRNQGSLPVKPNQTITLIDNVPEGIEITGFSNASGSSGWSCAPAAVQGPATVTCTNNGGLAGGSTSGIVLAAKGTFSGDKSFNEVKNTAAITGVAGRDTTGNLESSANVNVSEHQVDIGIAKTLLSAETVDSGDEVTYQLTVKNHDAVNPSTGIIVTDVLNNLVTAQAGCQFDASGNCEGPGQWPVGGFISANILNPVGQGSCSANGNSNSTSRTVTCNIAELAAGATAVIEIKARHFADNADGSNQPKAVTNQASVRSTEVEDPNSDNDTSNTVTVNVKPKTDIQVFKTATPEEAALGEPVIYTLHVYNAGPSYAAAVSLEDALPGNAHWIAKEFTNNTAACNGIDDDAVGQTLVCNWASPLAPNEQFAISYALRSSPTADPEKDVLDNTVDVDTTTAELTKANNRDTAQVALKKAELDVTINMQHTDDSLVLGKETEYTITVTNTGPSYATQVKVTDAFHSTLAIGNNQYPSSAKFSYEGMTELSRSTNASGAAKEDLLNDKSVLCVDPAVGSISSSGEDLVCIFDKLAPNETITIKFRMKAAELPEGKNTGTIFHNAKVELFEEEFLSNGSDTLVNNFTSDRTSARRTDSTPTPTVADLSLTKEADSEVSKDSPALKAGDPLVYTLTVTNLGPEVSPSSLVKDTLPEGLEYVAAAGCAYVPSTRELTCEVGELTVGADKEFMVETTIAMPYSAGPLLTNKAQVIAEGDPNPSNNEDETTTKVFVPATPVPTLGSLGMLALIALLAAFAVPSLRRRV